MDTFSLEGISVKVRLKLLLLKMIFNDFYRVEKPVFVVIAPSIYFARQERDHKESKNMVDNFLMEPIRNKHINAERTALATPPNCGYVGDTLQLM